MSVEVEGIEELSTRVTRQTSMINQICAQIDDFLQNQTEEDIVKISLDLDMSNVDVHVLEVVLSKYGAEIIGNDIFIKYDGVLKEQVHLALVNSAVAYNGTWTVVSKGMCVVAGNKYLPDIGIWFRNLTLRQRVRPIVNSCPPPNVWVEVFFNRNPDRSDAINKMAFVYQQQPGIEFVGVCLANSDNPFRRNPNPGVASVAATQQAGVPNRAPYIIHWDANFNPVYYKLGWNLHIVLRCGWAIEFNDILNLLS